ncbi:MAG: DNA-processing protein DprA [Chloroflexota bacterium]|nr:DNA-processing protein DprA [Chloroflexota bacterium]
MTTTAPNGAKYWMGFDRVPYIGPARIARLLDRFGSLERAWRASPVELKPILDQRALDSLVSTRATLSLDDEMARIASAGISVLSLDDPRYPPRLAQIPAPPPVLYLRGDLIAEDEVAVAMIGTRRLTAYGREATTRLAADLATAGVTIVSGLARGIDGVAHQAALAAGGRTLAVLGSGPDVIYPPEHRNMAARIAEQGALLSDYPPGRKPDAQNFPARNRIIAGLSLGVIVVEAPSRSGALITVDFAADQGRDVFAVPGSIFSAASAGCHRLLRDGARPVTCADDVLEELNLGTRQSQVAVQQAMPLEEDERRLLALLTGDPQHIDEVAAASARPIHEVNALLVTLELKGLVRNAGAQHYTRV